MPDEANAITAPISSEIALDHILHELRRALRSPIFRIRTGELGPLHDSAIDQGWLMPAPAAPRTCVDPRQWPMPGTIERLQLTDRGLKILAEDQCRNGLR
jgi:hypothetical protein